MIAQVGHQRGQIIGVPLLLEETRFGDDAIAAISGIAGISMDLLAQARSQMKLTGSLTALRALLSDPLVPKTDGFAYLITVKVQQTKPGQVHQHIGRTVTLQMQSRRGRIKLTMKTRLGRALIIGGSLRQSARVKATCTVATLTGCRSFHHCIVMVNQLHLGQGAWANAA